jgi:hypothetical protein
MPRTPLAHASQELIEEDGSFDSHFTEGARALVESLDAYIASHPPADASERKPPVRQSDPVRYMDPFRLMGHARRTGKVDLSRTSLDYPEQ